VELRHLVPVGLRYPLIRLLARRAPRLLPLYYHGVATGREFPKERITEIIEGVGYTRVYERYLRRWRGDRLTMLEIGVWRGRSLRMWQGYFPRATVVGLDIDPRAAESAAGFKVFVGSQDDARLLDQVVHEHPDLRLVVDDGSHVNTVTIRTFEHLFPLLQSGGIYAIEDMGVTYEESGLGPPREWPGMDQSPAGLGNRRQDMTEFIGRLLRDCDLGGRRRQVAFVHAWPMLLVVGRA
jgi:hypothetical protein